MAYPTMLKYHSIDQALHYPTYALIHVFTYLIILIAPHNEALLIPIPILFFYEQQQLYLFGLPATLHHD